MFKIPIYKKVALFFAPVFLLYNALCIKKTGCAAILSKISNDLISPLKFNQFCADLPGFDQGINVRLRYIFKA